MEEKEPTLRNRMSTAITQLEARAGILQSQLTTTNYTLIQLRELRNRLINDGATLSSVESAMTLLRKAGIE